MFVLSSKDFAFCGRIVTSETNSDYLVVPVEVEVSGQPGLFCPHDGLHFGLRTPHDPPTTLQLHLLNSAHKHIHIQVRFQRVLFYYTKYCRYFCTVEKYTRKSKSGYNNALITKETLGCWLKNLITSHPSQVCKM